MPASGARPKAAVRAKPRVVAAPRRLKSERPAKPEQPAPVLDAAQRKQLRGLAHHLVPVVQVGQTGITDPVVAATKQALLDHELIKVRLHEPQDKHGMAQDLATRTASGLCGLVGHTVILYKRHPSQPKIGLSYRWPKPPPSP